MGGAGLISGGHARTTESKRRFSPVELVWLGKIYDGMAVQRFYMGPGSWLVGCDWAEAQRQDDEADLAIGNARATDEDGALLDTIGSQNCIEHARSLSGNRRDVARLVLGCRHGRWALTGLPRARKTWNIEQAGIRKEKGVVATSQIGRHGH
jgi:hypothetical protein